MTIPKRVQEDLQDLQRRSETLVVIVQLTVIAILFALYYIAPADHTEDAPVRSAPFGLSLFTILVLLRCWFAYTNQLNKFFLGFCVIAEMSILLFTIWTYYLQFEATPAINLKNPHISFVFVLIALRALRFEPIWVILSGLTAAIGWAIMVWRVFAISGSNIVTWDYVTYASTRSIYPGGEFDKILAILLVTTIIAIVLKRARDTLINSVRETHAAADLSRFFDTGVADQIKDSAEVLTAGHGVTRSAAIVFTDMRGFTKASAYLSPTELICLLSEYQHLVVSIINKHNGSIDKFIGDGILASFGAVAISNTYAADCFKAVDEIMIEVEKWSAERIAKGEQAIKVGAGIDVGDVVFGVIGDEKRLEYTVIGEVVNLASKLEKHNKVEKVNALATLGSLEAAYKQGYPKSNKKEIRRGREVSGVSDVMDIVVIN